jgi:proteasome accessory factor B
MYFLVVGALQKVLTVSAKSERLVNLTIALLATRRYLTKAEIFATVAGYSGDPESKDRMFERDKDDLRSLGIEIELGTFDPLFEDEAGYRIRPQAYALQLKNLDSTSIAILSYAGQMWRDVALAEPAMSGLRKLKTIGLESDFDAISDITPSRHPMPEQIPDLVEAISERRSATFEYLDENLRREVRTVNPYRLSNKGAYWYLLADDREKKAIRTFRLDRIESQVTLGKSSDAFTLPSNETLEEMLVETSPLYAKVKIRLGRAELMRRRAEIVESSDEWDICSLTYFNESDFIRELLWQGSDCIVLEPASLRERMIATLETGVALHG